MYISTWPSLNPSWWLAAGRPGPLPFPLNASVQTCFLSARYAIYQLFRALGVQPEELVLVPDYHHGNEVRAIRAAGVSIRFYRVDRNLQPDLEELERLCRLRPRVLFVIHYLGWPQPVQELAALCRRHGITLIEDCALSLLSELDGKPLGSFGDYATFCLYKTLPVPNGGLLVENRQPLPALAQLQLKACGGLSVAGRTLELTLDWMRSRTNGVGEAAFALKRKLGQALNHAGLERLPMGNTGFDVTHAEVAASGLVPWLVRRFDYAAVRDRRRANYLSLAERLAGNVPLLKPNLEPGVCPLFFPILVRDKRAAAEAMWRRGIGAVEFWNEGDPEVRGDAFPDSSFLRKHVLELPIHQDVTSSQLDYMAGQVLQLPRGM